MDSHRPPPQQAHASSSAVEKLKSVVMKCAMASATGQRSRALIEKRIHELVVPTPPHHPPYAWMIENAIKELNEEGGGCDEKAISKFILEEYKDLPWAHPAFLSHHLKTGNLTQNHGKLRISPSPSPVSSSTPASTYAPSDSSASSQSYVQKRPSKKKKKKKKKKKSPRQKKRISARGIDDGEKMIQVLTGQVESDICLDDGMGEVDIISLLTEDEDEANIIQAQVDDQPHLHHTQTQQQIIVFEHEHEHEHIMGDQDDCSTPTSTTFPEKTKRIRKSRRGKRSERSYVNWVDEQVFTDLQRKEQQQESADNEVLFQQNHYCPKPKPNPKPKPRPRPYRNVVDIYESFSTATRKTN